MLASAPQAHLQKRLKGILSEPPDGRTHQVGAHPFLLADNRHYAFYLWRRIINLHPYARYALAPESASTRSSCPLELERHVGVSSASSSAEETQRNSATCAVLIPSPLLEPRYFLTSLLILRLYLSPSPSISSASTRSSCPLELERHVGVSSASSSAEETQRNSELSHFAAHPPSLPLPFALYLLLLLFLLHIHASTSTSSCPLELERHVGVSSASSSAEETQRNSE
jgi:hypothetical protein